MRQILAGVMVVAAVTVAGCSTVNKHVTRGFNAFTEMDYMTAEREFDQALKDNPNDPYAQLNMAAVYQNTGRAQLAVPLYEKVLTTGKDIRPNRKANAQKSNPTLAELAQENLLKMQQVRRP